ncbi:hypothetical protein JL722_12123 [Aureococcus anophagefferens]|nr:hypothetical protein JL722_12123 [Aureococcus anophagefferens]
MLRPFSRKKEQTTDNAVRAAIALAYDDARVDSVIIDEAPAAEAPAAVSTMSWSDVEAGAAYTQKSAQMKYKRVQTTRQDNECPVCLDPLTANTATVTLICGHLFCKECITDWASKQSTCPTCRATLEIAMDVDGAPSTEPAASLAASMPAATTTQEPSRRVADAYARTTYTHKRRAPKPRN